MKYCAKRKSRMSHLPFAFSSTFLLIFVIPFILLLLSARVHAVDDTYYCGQFDSDTTNGADGYFQIYSVDGVSTYTYEIDLKKFSTTCDLNNGLTYHIHSYWKNDNYTSTYEDECGSFYTGGHYDPGLACSDSSHYAETDCVDLNRTSSQGYTYECTTANYQAGLYSLCEKGDLSSKFGVAYPTFNDSNYFVSPTSFFTSTLIDYDAPYPGNWKNSDQNTGPWASIVIHCNEDGSRLICAELTKSESMCYEDDSDDTYYFTTWDIVLIVVGCVLFVACVALIMYWYVPRIIEESAEEAMEKNREEAKRAETAPLL